MIARVLSALLLVAVFVPAAGACEETTIAARTPTQAASLFGSPAARPDPGVPCTAVDRCSCPAFTAVAAVASTDPRKDFTALPAECWLIEISLVSLSTSAEARGAQLSAAAPPKVRPLYLLTARLRR